MPQNSGDPDIGRLNEVFAEACRFIEGELILHGQDPPRPGWLTRRKLKKAIRGFEEVIANDAGHWQSMWLIGKVYQRLRERRMALDWFLRARELNPGQPDVAREASLCAMDLGQGQLAVELCSAACACKPEDSGLVANLALAYLIAGRVEEAQWTAADAVARDPTDEVSTTVRLLVNQVASGARPCPRNSSEFA